MRIPLLRGRLFTYRDHEAGERMLLINETAATRGTVQRTREFGVRLAPGARAGEVPNMASFRSAFSA